MSINTIGPEEIARRKSASDAKNNTDDLTFNNGGKQSSNRARDVRNLKDECEMMRLCNSDDTSELEELFKSL